MMRRTIFALTILLVCYSCKEETTAITFKKRTIDNNFETSIAIEIDEATGNNDNAKQINNLVITEFLKGIPNSEDYTTLQDAAEGFENQYKSFKNDFEEAPLNWVLHLETEVLYQSYEVITILLSTYIDTGGAHGNDSIILLNINAQTGYVYSFEDIINNIEGFKTLAKAYFEKSIEAEEKTITDFFFGEHFKLPENIGFSDEGLIMLYNVYEIAGFSKGYTEFIIPFEELGNYLNIN